MIYKFKGFSLVEVLMTLLIMSLILVLAVPIATRKISFKESDGAVFTYTTRAEQTCPTTAIGSTDGNCSRYEFTIPKGIYFVNLTLVAGGGGGGGAAGMAYRSYGASPNIYSDNSYQKYVASDIKSLKISMTGRGSSKIDLRECKNNGDYYTTGAGEYSSAAILDYEIPSYFYQAYKDASGDPLLKYLIHDKYLSTSDANKNALYFIKSSQDEYCNTKFYTGCKDNFNYEKYCFIDLNRGITKDLSENNTLVRYGIVNTAANIKEGITGEEALSSAENGYCFSTANDDNIVNSAKYCFKRQAGGQGTQTKIDATEKENLCAKHSNNNEMIHFLGGAGGLISDTNIKGQGMPGCNWVLNCQTKTMTKDGPSGSINNELASISYVSKSWKYSTDNFISGEDLRLTGGGGGGGNAVRIKGFKVNPGETYVIYVGKGGSGGSFGKDYEATQQNVFVPANGVNGENGSATIIKRKNNDTETTLFYVLGGKGGNGGSNDTTNGGASNAISSGFYNNTGSAVNLDSSISSSKSGNTNPGNNTLVSVYYKFIREKNSPYWALNYINSTKQSGVKGTYSTNIENQDYLKAFSDFNHPKTSGGFAGHLQYKNNVTVNGIIHNSDDDGIYDGFYYRTFLKNYTIGYVGGLGGFSGLGGKAGCGGLFMGNSFGAVVNNDLSSYHFNPIYENKFIINTEQGNIAFNVGDYYDNCSNNTSNGQSASFVMPNPRDLTFGQAGAGGGGGGYSVDLGPGNGGDGQNGYVMIDWRK